tara:strand:- start:501 stop:1604 length:1104 start_codon:yes stop_codon:yes gene_type:complete
MDCGDGTGTSSRGKFVFLTPSGVLEMTASWVDRPKAGQTYNVYILTNYRDPPSSAVHVKNGLTFDTEEMFYEITETNKDEFTPIGATVGNFPGFELGQMYRLYIEYFDAEGVQLNTGSELSEFATPLIEAAAPRDVTACGWLDTHAPCDEIPYNGGTIHSFRVYWQSPPSRGYGSYVPPDNYQVEYYKLQISDTSAFEQVRAEDRCNTGQANDFTVLEADYNDFCNFDQRVAVFYNVKRYWSSMPNNQDIYVRIAAGTVLGDGNWSAPLAVRPTNIWFQIWSNMKTGMSFDEFVMQNCALIPHARWEPWTPHVPGTPKPMATHCGCMDGYTEKWSWDEEAKTQWRSLPVADLDYALHAPTMHCLPCG